MLLIASGCVPQTHVTVSSIIEKGKTGDQVDFDFVRVESISHDPIMKQTSFYLQTDETNKYVRAVVGNKVVERGLEKLQSETEGLYLKITGTVSEHSILGPFIFINSLEIIDQ